MIEIVIRLQVEDDESIDENDPTGLTEEAYTSLSSDLASHGSIIDIKSND